MSLNLVVAIKCDLLAGSRVTWSFIFVSIACATRSSFNRPDAGIYSLGAPTNSTWPQPLLHTFLAHLGSSSHQLDPSAYLPTHRIHLSINVSHGHTMIMENLETISALSLESKPKYRLMRSTSQTSFTEKCLEPSNEMSLCYLEGSLSNERSTSAESVVVSCSEALSLSQSPSDTLTDSAGDQVRRVTVLQKVKTARAVAVPRGGSLEDSLSPVTKAGSDDNFSLHSIITSFSTDTTRGKLSLAVEYNSRLCAKWHKRLRKYPKIPNY